MPDETPHYSDAEPAEAAALEHYLAQPEVQKVEWKTRGHDQAPGLHEALVSSGFEPEETESVMVGEALVCGRCVVGPSL